MDESGVRRSCETAASSAVRSVFDSARRSACAAAALQRASLQCGRDLRCERAEDVGIVQTGVRAVHHEHLAGTERHRDRCVLGPRRRRFARDDLHRPRVVVAPPQHRDRVGRKQLTQLRDDLGQRVVSDRDRPGQARERLGMGRARRRPRASGGRQR